MGRPRQQLEASVALTPTVIQPEVDAGGVLSGLEELGLISRPTATATSELESGSPSLWIGRALGKRWVLREAQRAETSTTPNFAWERTRQRGIRRPQPHPPHQASPQ